LGFKVGTFLDVTPLQFGGDTNTPAQTATTSMEDLSANASHVSARVLFDLSDLAGNSWVITDLVEMRYSRGEIFSHLSKFCLLQHARSRAARLCIRVAGRVCRIVRSIESEQTS
jgi:hypothetical protein